MPIFTYSEVEEHVTTWQDDLEASLISIDNTLRENKNSGKLPIYSTKWRIKSPSSAYLKARSKSHKYQSLNEITDFGGYRILCMYEQDIPAVHNFVIKELLKDKKLKLDLIEFQTFNWENIDATKLNKVVEEAGFMNMIVPSKETKKDSGYRSVHYLVKLSKLKEDVTIEIQLRTLLQDVWSEIEHSLSYKNGFVDPYITRNFQLLASSLKTNDSLVAHLYEISEKQSKVDLSHGRRSKPFAVFAYDVALDSKLFETQPNIGKLRTQYDSFVKEKKAELSNNWTNEASKMLDHINNKLTAQEKRSDKKYEYWEQMEHAFLCFHNSELDSARKKYKQIIESGETGQGLHTYVTYFRYGEIQFITGDITQALVAFDEAERICKQQIDSSQKSPSKFGIDLYRIQTKLANIYWRLGSQYYQAALTKIVDAKTTFEKNKSLLVDTTTIKKDEASLVNNVCWYYLEQYLVDKSKESYEKAKQNYDSFLNLANENPNILTLNMLDTAAWFCFMSYKKENSSVEKRKWLEKAKEHSNSMRGTGIPYRSTLEFFSSKVHLEHFEAIQCEEF